MTSRPTTYSGPSCANECGADSGAASRSDTKRSNVETAYQIQTFASSTGTVLFTPRTRLDTDPVWAVEQEHEVMLTSPLTGLTNPATGLVALAMELETIAVYPSTQMLVGGFRLTQLRG